MSSWARKCTSWEHEEPLVYKDTLWVMECCIALHVSKQRVHVILSHIVGRVSTIQGHRFVVEVVLASWNKWQFIRAVLTLSREARPPHIVSLLIVLKEWRFVLWTFSIAEPCYFVVIEPHSIILYVAVEVLQGCTPEVVRVLIKEVQEHRLVVQHFLGQWTLFHARLDQHILSIS